MDFEQADWTTPWPNGTSDLRAIGDESMVAYPQWRRSSDDPWFGYVEGYRLAAQAIVNQAKAAGHANDSLIFPFLMCWRHYVEIQLKSLINLMQRGLGHEVDVPGTHNLAKLWERSESLLAETDAFGDDKSTRHVRRLILQLHALDPTAQEARYPITTKGLPTFNKVSRLDMRAIHVAMEGVAKYLTGTDVGLTEHFRFRRELAEEFRNDW
ncbi:hypothetical protein [Nonomuraea maritima]|uniref:hypothetical protein n=1 Tax=Nonomuraea maritima TaxID=683260 RepID=UPI00371B10B8